MYSLDTDESPVIKSDFKKSKPDDSQIAVVKGYHDQTKHRLSKYAKGPETLDWDNQPNPFRYFSGCDRIDLPFVALEHEPSFSELPVKTSYPLTMAAIAYLLRCSLALTGWKQFGPDKWSLRVNPSSGNLHPTEAYLLLGNEFDEELSPGLYHFNVEQFQLEKRAEAAFTTNSFGEGFLLGLSSVIWREAWKYGERSFRYCQLDIGHSMSAVTFAAAALGWRTYWLATATHKIVASLLGCDREEFIPLEREEPECLLFIGPGRPNDLLLEEAIEWISFMCWHGRPDSLGEPGFYRWPVVDSIAEATREGSLQNEPRPAVVELSESREKSQDKGVVNTAKSTSRSFFEVISKRRSAQRFEPTMMNQVDFIRILMSVVSGEQAIANSLAEHEVMFLVTVHRVEGIPSGIYLLSGKSIQASAVSAVLTKWTDHQDVTELFNLQRFTAAYRLKHVNAQKAAATLCCHQSIAADCSFMVSFLAPFQPLDSIGAPYYRYVHWQAGMMAHKIYLAASEQQWAATAIGCFFDDAWHELLGLDKDLSYQVIYHIAVGKNKPDNRLIGLSAYHHLNGRAKTNIVLKNFGNDYPSCPEDNVKLTGENDES